MLFVVFKRVCLLQFVVGGLSFDFPADGVAAAVDYAVKVFSLGFAKVADWNKACAFKRVEYAHHSFYFFFPSADETMKHITTSLPLNMAFGLLPTLIL